MVILYVFVTVIKSHEKAKTNNVITPNKQSFENENAKAFSY